MRRLPDRLFAIVKRIYLAQDRMRREEGRLELARQDRAQREYYDNLYARHGAGICGGAEAGCCYVPCVSPVGWGIE